MPEDPAAAIIKNQLKVKHWSVLNFGYVVLHFTGFSHDTVMQLIRHQDCSPLVASMRYTGDTFIHCANRVLSTEQVFYAQPVGVYSSPTGAYTYTAENRAADLAEYHLSAVAYKNSIERGNPPEVARRLLSIGHRQNFVLAGTVGAMFHMLDQRTLGDSQSEAQTLAWMALDVLEDWEPGLFKWYRLNRAGKNLLAP
jgi:thymidylate synthase (FAD)